MGNPRELRKYVEVNSITGIKLNNKTIGGSPNLVEEDETLVIPVNYELRVSRMASDGNIICDGTLIID